MFLALLVVSVYGLFSDLRYGDKLSPLTLKWPSSWVNSRISANSNYAGNANTLYIDFSVDSLPATSGLVANIKVGSDTTWTACTVSAQSAGATDYRATCAYSVGSNLILGPINIVLFQGANTNQIVAQDTSVGYIAFWSGTETTSAGGLTVSYTNSGSTATHVVGASESLTFQFTLPSGAGLYPGDYLVLTPESKFGGSVSSLALSWDTSQTANALFNSTKLVTLANTAGTVTSLFIAGLSNAVAAGSTVSFKIAGWTNVLYEYSSTSYSWTLNVRRFGADTLIQGYTGSGPSTGVTVGAITVTTFAPYSSAFGSTPVVLATMANYWTLSFTTAHNIPASGQIVVTFSTSVSLNDYTYTSGAKNALASLGVGSDYSAIVSFSDATKSASLVIAAQTATINLDSLTSITAGTTITLYAILKISSAPTINTIYTKQTSGGINIDGMTTAKTVSLTSPATGLNVVTPTVDKTFAYLATFDTKGTARRNLGDSTTFGGLLIYLKVSDIGGALASGDVVTVYLLAATGTTTQDTYIAFPSTPNSFQGPDAADPVVPGSVTYTASGSPSFSAGSNGNHGSISVTLNAAVSSGSAAIWLGAQSGTAAYTVYHPIVHKKLPGEMVIKVVKNSVSPATTYYWSTTLSFDTVTLGKPSITMQCKNLLAPGSPVIISAPVPSFSPPSGYIVLVTFSAVDATPAKLFAANSHKLNNLDKYPSFGSSQTFYVINSQDVIAFNATSFPTSPVAFNVPSANTIKDGNVVLTVKVYLAISSNGASYLYGSADSDPFVAAVRDYTATFMSAKNKKFTVGTADASNTVTIAAAAAATDISYIVILPVGYSSTDSSITGSGTGQYQLSSTNPKFPFSVFVKAGGLQTNSVTTTTIAPSITPPGVVTAATNWYVTSIVSSTLSNSACKEAAVLTATAADTGTLETIASSTSIAVSSYSPATCSVQSYKGKVLGSSVTFTIKSTTVAIVTGSIISITIGWTPSSSSTWSVVAGSTTLTGTVSGSIWSSAATTAAIAANTAISVTVTGVMLPTSASTIVGVPSVAVSYSSINYITYSDSGSSNTVASVVTAATSTTSKSTVWVFPNVPGSKGVYFGLGFTASALVISGSTLTIAPPSGSTGPFTAVSTTPNFKVWSTHSYSAVTVSASSIVLTLSQDIKSGDAFQVVVDGALDLASSLTNATNLNYLVNTASNTGESSVVISDSAITGTQTFTLGSASLPAVKTFVFGFTSSSSSQSGFNSWHSFNTTLNADSPSTFWLDFNAVGDYAAVPGPSFTTANYGTGYQFLTATDNSGSTVLCYAVHWVVSCYIGAQVKSGSVAGVRLWLKNGQATGNWNLFVTDSSNNLIAQPFYGLSTQALTFTNGLTNAVSSILDLYTVTPSFANDATKDTADLTLNAFISVSGKAGDSILVAFPKPFQISQTNPSSVKCSLTYYNNGATNTVVNVISGGSCTVDNNNCVRFTLPAAQTFANTNWTIFTINSVFSPTDGFARSTLSTYEVGTAPGFYTGDFQLYYVTSANVLSASSFDNLNGAFTGFSAISGYTRIVVNGGNPIDITVGTYSGPYLITAGASLLSTMVVATPSSSTVVFDSSSYNLTYILASANFSIGVAATASFGTYVVSWSINETPAPGGSAKYLRPRPTLVNVNNVKTYAISFSPSTINVPPGGVSFPVSASISPSLQVVPFSSVTLSFASANSSILATASPSTISLTNLMPMAFFTLNCSNCVNGTSYNVNVTLGGDCAAAFTVSKQISFVYQAPYSAAAQVTASVPSSNVLSSSLTYNYKSDTNAVLTLVICPSSVYASANLTYASALAKTFVLGSVPSANSSAIPFSQQVTNWGNQVSQLINSGSSYTQIVNNIISAGNVQMFTSQQTVTAAAQYSWPLNIFVPSTTYYFSSWTDNYSGQPPTADTQNATTAALPAHAQVTLSVASVTSNLVGQIAVALKWNSKYIALSSSRNRQLVTASVYVYADPSSSSVPLTVIQANQAALALAVGGNVTSSGAVLASNYTAGAFSSNAWIVPNGIQLVFNYTTVSAGNVYCTYASGGGAQLTSNQVLLGVSSTGAVKQVTQAAVAGGSANITFNFTALGFVNSTTLSVNCIACNNYPGTPNCSAVVFTNYSYTGGSSAAQLLMVAIAAYLFI